MRGMDVEGKRGSDANSRGQRCDKTTEEKIARKKELEIEQKTRVERRREKSRERRDKDNIYERSLWGSK